MKAFAHLGTAVLLLSFGSVIPAFAQQEQAKPEQKPAQQHAQQQPQQHAQQPQAQPQQHAQQQAQQQNQQKAQQQQAQQHNQQAQQQNQQAQHQQQANQQRQQQAQHSPEQQHAQQAAWQSHQSQNWNSDHRTWQQRGGYHGYRIPDNRYNGYFGPNYGFVIYNQPYMVVGGFPRFQYNGFWFSVVDPWPNTWANNWYQTDDVYIVYQDNGYYMYNQRYPGIGIAISVSM
jgi:flagellar motor protein MotB